MAFSLIWKEDAKASRYVVPDWEERGVLHGFLGCGIETSKGGAEFEREFENRGVKLRLCLLSQVHGTELSELLTQDAFLSASTGPLAEADGWLVYRRCFNASEDHEQAAHYVFGIRTADCTPVLIYVTSDQYFAALHCGWRSTFSGLLPKTIKRLFSLGVHPKSLQLALGPSAQGCCYEVGEELVADLDKETTLVKHSETPFWEERDGKIYLNLQALLLAQARSSGLNESQLFLTETCTICSKQFFSYRREKSFAGRQVSFIGAA
jgi:YfiH family protein